MIHLLRKSIFLLPLIMFIALALFFWKGLNINPRLLPSALINKPVPKFNVKNLLQPEQHLSDQLFKGHVSLLNVWATWCEVCQQEHPFLMSIAEKQIVPIYGLDYKDNQATAKQFLNQYGNPYQAIGFDQTGTVAINWGVYGTPETFIIDKQGIIRYKYVGEIDNKVWQHELLPIIQKLKRERIKAS